MRYIRTPIGSATAFALGAVKAHARITATDEDPDLYTMAGAAVAEIEARTDLALVAQVITATFDAWGDIVALPVAPFYAGGLADHPVTVQLRDLDGNLTAHPAGWWIEAGLWPVLHLPTRATGDALIVTYPAGFGAGPSDMPADLQAAINDQATQSYDLRGADKGAQGLSLQASRIVARYKRVRL
ncbi:MAG: hypothetical protein ACK4GO_09410 [Gemmobacter sp.]